MKTAHLDFYGPFISDIKQALSKLWQRKMLLATAYLTVLRII